jgi:hypothetical protein
VASASDVGVTVWSSLAGKNTILEFKTLRSSNIDKPKGFQEEQLRYYMAMQNSSVGYMVYQCLMHFGDRVKEVCYLGRGRIRFIGDIIRKVLERISQRFFPSELIRLSNVWRHLLVLKSCKETSYLHQRLVLTLAERIWATNF